MTNYYWGARSLHRLKMVHPRLVTTVTLALRHYAVDDITVVEGLRDIQTQMEYVARGVSWTMLSKHLAQADEYAHAVDLGPWINGRIPWEDYEAFKRMADAVFKAADYLGYHIVWGGNWPTRKDGPHFQLG